MKTIKINSKKIEKGQVIYTALVSFKDATKKDVIVEGKFNAQFLKNYVELKMIDNIIMLHIQDRKLFDKVMKFYDYQNFSKLKRKSKKIDQTFLGNKEFKAWFTNLMTVFVDIHKDKNIKLLKPITKLSANKIIQPMPCYLYLAGIKKANVNYIQSDYGLKTSNYDKEQMKEKEVKTWFAVSTQPVKKVIKQPQTKTAKKETIKKAVKKETAKKA